MRNSSCLCIGAATVFALGFVGTAHAGLPNDECDGAIEIFDGANAFSTIGATDSGPELPAECDEGFGLAFVEDIWFSYTATCDGTLTASTCDQADYDTRLAAYSDCAGSLVACNDDGAGCGGFTSILEVPVVEGTTYFIRVGGFGTSGTGTLTLTCGDGGGGEVADECVDAIEIFDGDTPFSTVGATTSAGFELPPECDEGFGTDLVEDIWYTYTATCTGPIEVSTCDQADYDTRLAAYTDCDPATLVGCNDDGDGCGGFTSILTFDASIGTKYFIRVGGFATSGSGTITISCSAPPCPGECIGDLVAPFGTVDGADLGVLLAGWGSDDPCLNLSGDGTVDGNDLGLLLGAWGDCPAGACESCSGGGGIDCDLQVGVNGGFMQECEDGQWVSLAFPIQTGGAMIDTVSSVHNSNTGLGSIYICGGTCGGPDVNNILATLCCAVEGEPAGEKVEHCFPAVPTSGTDPTWIVMTFHTGFSFDVAYDSDTAGTVGVAYGNLDGGSDPGLWGDLNDFGFGACYCVGLSSTGCEAPDYSCPGQLVQACCFSDGTCEDITGAECSSMGGTPQGPDTTCAGAKCIAICGKGAGDCFIDNGTPGCDDVDCCEAVCAVDAFCCDVAWDGICADQAVDICGPGECSPNPACGVDGSGDCTDPKGTGTPGCEDEACCNCVCQLDPFCCDVEWDSLCASEAAAEPECAGGGGDNDECVDALEIFEGDTAFSTVGATDSGPELPAECDKGFGLAFVEDIWYFHVAQCTGTLTVSTCDSADYDTRLAAYSDCDGSFVACNDDGEGCGGFTSIMEVPVVEGETYLIRIGGFGTSGTGIVNLSCN